ncbi:hypothetical protein [Sphingorhabdus sp. M41]|uniref:hypothetical protein n=1 Tax=Sphingorhabdus sp. M41 TaxID=1806885 RepID=UPI00078EC8C9|nr:hypothetical protein [Sphingorhabdus sp. M41]AMO71762.1 hypothetical protein AZE99_07765 [Sphingorhabdus sp. M41]
MNSFTNFENFLTGTAVIAVILFVLREIIEAVKKWKSDQRKLSALKKILSREIELNFTSLASLEDALTQASKQLKSKPRGEFRVVSEPSGKETWQTWKNNGERDRGGMLRRTHKAASDKTLLTIAEISPKLLRPLEEYIDSTSEIEHLRSSLIDYAHPEASDQNLFPGFTDWALDQLESIRNQQKQLFILCAGKELSKGRLR